MDKSIYANMQKNYYNSRVTEMHENHSVHDINDDYWNILLKPIDDNDKILKNKFALDFGCGHGRNVRNMLKKNIFKRVDGIDISEENIKYAKENILKETGTETFDLYSNNGIDLNPLKDDEYSFIMSTIVLQHICVYETRLNILKEFYRIMKKNGILSFQMGFGDGHPKTANYYDNVYDATSTNSGYDVKLVNPENEIVKDLNMIGFKDIEYVIRNSHSDRHNQWIFIKCKK